MRSGGELVTYEIKIQEQIPADRNVGVDCSFSQNRSKLRYEFWKVKKSYSKLWLFAKSNSVNMGQ
jgi:hypothetical protein